MSCFRYRLIIMILCLGSLIACDKASRQPETLYPAQTIAQSAAVPKKIFQEPVQPAYFELASGALSIWRNYAATRPALVLFASHPLLNPIEPRLSGDILTLLSSASDQELICRGSATASDALLVSPQTLSAALLANLFSELILVLPTREKPDNISLEKLQKRLTDAGFLTPEEGQALTLTESTISGTVRGLPLRIVHPQALPALSVPFILHADLGFFKESYVNEIKTPVYDLIYEFTASLREANYQPIATTLSFSNQEVGYALTSRFVLRDLALLMRQPELLNGGTPASWSLRASSLKANIMFNETESRELLRQAAKSTPGDAAALFDLALLNFQQAQPDAGFNLLDQAVAIDPGFALAYIDLANQGQEMGQWNKSFELLYKVAAIFPDNDEIRIRLAGDLIQRGRAAEARPLLDELADRNWSAIYHPGIPETLVKMQEAARVDSLLPLPDEPAPSAVPSRPPMSMPPSHMGSPMQRHP